MQRIEIPAEFCPPSLDPYPTAWLHVNVARQKQDSYPGRKQNDDQDDCQANCLQSLSSAEFVGTDKADRCATKENENASGSDYFIFFGCLLYEDGFSVVWI